VAEADVDTLQALVEKSLLRFANERYSMLETIRDFAAEQLAEVLGGVELVSATVSPVSRQRPGTSFARGGSTAQPGDCARPAGRGRSAATLRLRIFRRQHASRRAR
jgi:hypothetical protein